MGGLTVLEAAELKVEVEATVLNRPRPDAVAPWLHGPLELVKHANGHLLDGGDTDRPLALIGFDNAVEVCIDVYLRLHPKLRGGVELEREAVDKARRNYHTKLEFLDGHLQSKELTGLVAVDQVLWFHELRNELYHSGNGMVPELHVIEGARTAALGVFRALFGVDAGLLLQVPEPAAQQASRPMPAVTQSNEMEFLRVFIEFETLLRATLEAAGHGDAAKRSSVVGVWRDAVGEFPKLRHLGEQVSQFIQARNALVHNQTDRPSDSELERLAFGVLEAIDAIESLTKRPTRSQSDQDRQVPRQSINRHS